MNRLNGILNMVKDVLTMIATIITSILGIIQIRKELQSKKDIPIRKHPNPKHKK